MTNTTLTGTAAIDFAARSGLTLSKRTDPTEEARDGLSVDEARDVAKEDAGLIYLDVEGMRVAGGKGEDADAGRIDAIRGDEADVAWDSGVRTWSPLSTLRAE